MLQGIVTYIIIALAAAYAILRVAADFKRNDEHLGCDHCDACRMKKELLAKSRKSKQTKDTDTKSSL